MQMQTRSQGAGTNYDFPIENLILYCIIIVLTTDGGVGGYRVTVEYVLAEVGSSQQYGPTSATCHFIIP